MSPRLKSCGTLLSPDMSIFGRFTVLCITLPGITHNEGFNCWLSWGEVNWKFLVFQLNLASELRVLSFHIYCNVTDAQLDVDECRPRPTERADCTSLTGECQNSAESNGGRRADEHFSWFFWARGQTGRRQFHERYVAFMKTHGLMYGNAITYTCTEGCDFG